MTGTTSTPATGPTSTPVTGPTSTPVSGTTSTFVTGTPSAFVTAPPSTLEDFLTQVARHPNSKLVFVDNGTKIRPNYHVTELKSMSVRSIDCGRRQSTSLETIIQLLDGPMTEAGTHMPASKFAAIVKAGLAALPELGNGELYFEYAPGNEGMRKLSVVGIEYAGERTLVTLGARKATCKPIERYLETATVENTSAGCCGFSSSACCAI